MPRVDFVLETVLYADELDRAQAFYTDVMGLTALVEDTRMRALDVDGRAVLLLFRRGATTEPVDLPWGQSIPPHDGAGPLHLAFAAEPESFPDWRAHLARHGVEIESEVDWPNGGKSLYFRDPEGHCVEIATPGLWRG